MMSIETRINGLLIGFGYVVNKGEADNDLDFYSVEYHRPGQEPDVLRFNLVHKREEGAEKLSLLVYKELDKLLKGKKIKKPDK